MTLDLRAGTISWFFVTAISYGLYLASFVHCVRWLLFEDEGWRVRKKVNPTLVTTTLLIFFLSTISFSGNEAWQISQPIPISSSNFNSSIFYLSVPIIIDGVMIHRCWIVFSKNWFIICFPLTLWCSCLVCASISFYCDFINLSGHLDPAVINEYIFRTCIVGPYGRVELFAFYICNIVANIYTTSALVFKIWSAAESNVGTNRLSTTSQILTESGILYTLSSGFYLASLIFSHIINNAPKPVMNTDSYFWSDLLLRMAAPDTTFLPGIAFNLITIRVGEQRVRGQDTWVDSRDTSKVILPSELLNRPDTLTQQETESTDLGQERHERVNEGVLGINETEFGEIMEVDRSKSGS